MHRANHPKPSAKAAVSGCGPCAGMIMVYLFHENDGCAEWTLPHTENLTIIDGPPDWKRSRRFQKLHLTQSHRWEIRYIHIYIYDPVLSIVDGQIYFLIIPSLRTEEDVQPQLTRRRPGQSSLTTARNETDTVTILSGTERRSGDGGRLGEAGISWGWCQGSFARFGWWFWISLSPIPGMMKWNDRDSISRFLNSFCWLNWGEGPQKNTADR